MSHASKLCNQFIQLARQVWRNESRKSFVSHRHQDGEVQKKRESKTNDVIKREVKTSKHVNLILGILQRDAKNINAIIGAYWHKHYNMLSTNLIPSLCIQGHLLQRPFFWHTFWSLPMTGKTFTL